MSSTSFLDFLELPLQESIYIVVFKKEEFSLSGFSFSLFIDIHDWTEAKHGCKLFSAAAVTCCKGLMQLANTSVEVVRDKSPEIMLLSGMV